jgi:cytochrome c553
MKRKFQRMITKNCLCLILALHLAILAPLPAFGAVADAVHDPHRLPSNDEFQKTIEARCTICHTREQVDAAIIAQEDLDALLQRMIERGAILSEKDKSVLGTFWGSPIKPKE